MNTLIYCPFLDGCMTVIGVEPEKSETDIAKRILAKCLDETGRPRNPRSIFVGVRKTVLEGIDFSRALRMQTKVAIPVNFLPWNRPVGSVNQLEGVVRQINEFVDGTLVILRRTGGLLTGWPVMPLWIPRAGNYGCGVLN